MVTGIAHSTTDAEHVEEIEAKLGDDWPDLTPLQRNFLAAFALAGSVRRAEKAARASRRSHSRWMATDPDYAEAFEQTRRVASDMLEEEARRRAVEGWEEPIFQNGKQVGVKRRYSDTLLIFLLKGNNPAKFGDRVEQTHRGNSPVALFELPKNGREIDVQLVDDWYGPQRRPAEIDAESGDDASDSAPDSGGAALKAYGAG
ncbi:hypothetical protein [Botrimarina sp.]|uniref:hypothetical protein n=1 Tax=Botrimarina sp. TaxID=2795802 RepID=UPI0032EFCDCA